MDTDAVPKNSMLSKPKTLCGGLGYWKKIFCVVLVVQQIVLFVHVVRKFHNDDDNGRRKKNERELRDQFYAKKFPHGCSPKCYASRYIDLVGVIRSDSWLVKHYFERGIKEGRECSCGFIAFPPTCSHECYAIRYKDLMGDSRSKKWLAAHYNQYGKSEGRDCTCDKYDGYVFPPECSSECYSMRYPDLVAGAGGRVHTRTERWLVTHYNEVGIREKRDCSCDPINNKKNTTVRVDLSSNLTTSLVDNQEYPISKGEYERSNNDI